MSKDIKVVFTHGTGLFSGAIEAVEILGEEINGDNGVDFVPTHCGLIVDDRFQEALSDGFIGNSIHHYDPKDVRIYTLHISNEDDIKRGDATFARLLGQKYSVKALVCGLVFTVFSMIIPGPDAENDCSGDDTTVLRDYGFNINNTSTDGEPVPASSITPNILIGIIDKIGKLSEV
jgi:hypothetical protein